jgi:hypothetical protein
MSAVGGLVVLAGMCCVLQWIWLEQNVARVARRHG